MSRHLSIEKALGTAAAQLTKAGASETPKLDAEVLLAHVIDRDRTWLMTWPERTLTPEQQEQFESLVARRVAGEPVAYLTGWREFWSLPLQVNPATLIPRPETELLVETALQLMTPDSTVVDLGTGSGAIALAMASEFPEARILAVDASAAALAVANRNRRQVDGNRLALMQGHWGDALAPAQFDLVISNPPYIDPEDPHLGEGDVRFEPRSALAAAEQGLADIRVIAEQSRQLLKAGGWLLLEHGFAQKQAVAELLIALGYCEVECHADLSGQDRVTRGRHPGDQESTGNHFL